MIGKKIHNFAKELWPINRSITGEGLRKTLRLIKNKIPNLKIYSVSSGKRVFDWHIPKEWKIDEAYIITPNGKKICEFSKNNLHVVGYSSPFKGKVSYKELMKHLYTLPKQPTAVPYVTSYYKKRWGFCIKYNELKKLKKKSNYEVLIKSQLFNGYLNYGELVIPGKTKKEIFLSTYICHPSMANNELSGPTILTFLSSWINQLKDRHYTYRIVFVPETIGSITYLSRNYKYLKKNVIAGFNLTCLGDNRNYSYVPSRNGDTLSDHVAKHVLKWIYPKYKSYSWLDRGSDERQYCSPGIDLPIASIHRSKYGEYPEYHTSLDNLKRVVTPNGLEGGFNVIKKSIELIEKNKNYKILTLCEPQMSKRGLYPSLSTKHNLKKTQLMMSFISYCDGKTSLLTISEKLKVPAWELYNLIEKLLKKKLIKEKR